MFADANLPGITVRDGLFYGGGLTQLGVQILAIAVVWAWSFGTMFPFYWLAGVVFGGTWRNPRKGLRLDFVDTEDHQADPHLHDCLEDPTGKILSEVGNMMLHRESDTLRASEIFRISLPGSRRTVRNTPSRTSILTEEDTEVWDADSDGTQSESQKDEDIEEPHRDEAVEEGSNAADAVEEGHKRYRHFQLFRSTRRL